MARAASNQTAGGKDGKPRRRRLPRREVARRTGEGLVALARRMARDPAICTDGAPSKGGSLELELPLELLLDGGEDEAALRVAAALQERLAESLAAASRRGPGLTPGAAWCYLCREPGCPHCEPPDADSVLSGYAPTGTPRWESFSAVCLQEAPERSGQLYGPYAQLVALVRSGAELCRDLLPEFGGASGGLRLLAQLDCGYLPLGDERRAVSLQVLRVHPQGARPRVILHSVGFGPRDLEIEPAEFGGFDPQPLRDLLRSTARRLDGLLIRRIGLKRGGAGEAEAPALEELAEGTLSKLKGGLERMFRHRRRRTLHAGERARQAGRPVERSLRDALGARDRDLYWDPSPGTVVVLGPKGRVHVFTPTGRLVTSLKLEGDQVRRRVDQGRWRPLNDEETSDFRRAVARREGSG